MGIFTLHRFNGIEQFEITEGKVYAVKNQDKRIMLWLEVETDEQPLRSMTDTTGCGMHPSGYDEKSRTFIASLYYFEHQEVVDNKLWLAYKGDGMFQARWTGATPDAVHYDSSKPNMKMEVSGDFFFEDYKDWL